MYFEGLNSNFCDFIENKIRYTTHTKISEILINPLYDIENHDNFYEVHPLFNYDTCTSTNPKDHTKGNTLILIKDQETLLSFDSQESTMDYTEASTVQEIDDIRYTLYYTYNNVTGEPAPFQMTSAGRSTDRNGYFLDSEVIE